MQREHLKSRLGFILLSAGCAIGIGNVWKFPYIAGQYGGGIFVLIYLFFLVVLGVPVLTMEFSLGRASQKSPARLYQELEPKGTKWHLHGYFAVAGNYILMMFYTTVAGWLLQYFVWSAQGVFDGMDASAVALQFGDMLSNPVTMTIYMGIVVVMGFVVNSFGLQKGLERVTKPMMIALIVLMLVLAINSIMLPGGQAGLEFYLLPSLERIKSIGIVEVITGAMNQSFFTLSLGIGAMAIFGSYLKKDRTLLGEAVNVAALDTFVAFSAGLIIFPACSAYGVQVNSGPNLIFVTLPNVFNHLPMGRLWGSLFFLFMSFAALSTVFAVFENIISCTCDYFGWSRKQSCLINGILMFILSVPCVLGFNIWSGFAPFGGTSTIQDLEDFIVSNLLLPLGSLVYVLFCVTRYGWGWNHFAEEANTGAGMKVQPWMKGYMTYVLPLIVIVVFVANMINYFM